MRTSTVGTGCSSKGVRGGVGSLAVQLAKSIGASVSATATAEDQPLVRSLGADAVVESPDAALAPGEPGFDVLLNTFGGPVPPKSTTSCARAVVWSPWPDPPTKPRRPHAGS